MTIQAHTAPKKKTALVLDNDPTARREIGTFLSCLDYRVRYCADFISALEEMEFDDAVDMVVADYHLLGGQQHTFNGMCFIDCCRMRYPYRNIRYFLTSEDCRILAGLSDDPEVPMLAKDTVVEQLTTHIGPRYPLDTQDHYGRLQA